MPWWISSRHGDENWPSHMERRRDGSSKVKAKKPLPVCVYVVEDCVDERKLYFSGSGSSTTSTASTFSSRPRARSPRRYLPLPVPAPSPPVPAAVVTVDYPADTACGSTESCVGGSDTESGGHSRSSASSSSASSTTSSSGSRRGSSFEDTTSYRPRRSLSPTPSASSTTSRHSIPLDFSSNVSSVSVASAAAASSSSSSSSSSLPHPREPSPPPSPVFPRPPASPASSSATASASGSTSTTSSSRSTPKPNVSVDVVTCEPAASIAGSGRSIFSSSDGSSQVGSNDTSSYSVPAVVTVPEQPIALRRTWARPQPMPVLQPIQTDFPPYQVGYSPYVPYPAYDALSPSTSRSKHRVRRADRTPRSPWAFSRTPRTPKTPKTPRTPRLARTPRAVRIKPRKREPPRIIQVPRSTLLYSAPAVGSPFVDGPYRGRPLSPTGSYVRTESGSRERRRQLRAALAARKAEASAAAMAVEAAAAAAPSSSSVATSSRSYRSGPSSRVPPKIIMGDGSSISSRRSHRSHHSHGSRRPLTPIRVVAPQLPTPRRRKSALALSRHRTEPIRSPIFDVHRPPPRTPRRQSATAGLASDPRVARADDPTWGDYLKGGSRVVQTRPVRRSPYTLNTPNTVAHSRSRKSTASSKPSLFGGYYESTAPRKSRASTPTARSMRPLDDILAYLRPRESSIDPSHTNPPPKPRRTAASMAPRMAAARREATRRGEQLSESTSESRSMLRSRSRSQSRM
ncbi:uncharacterized protein SPSK_08696 [Sporothrix schenckii 1099-18]|uniref:Uncharacterized protein n=1 Tax=Sporothrix schenckii 1099-18 TaxID=1397361 RepID=A0A0F2M941_SPOSC|nr:uncharacterized protein SPSK_08696 [Sporothrix schenckii 1099-18]KJR85599.1 hypothetical protein SPSK_08696 [Sporothrix schenckii 1099-18]